MKMPQEQLNYNLSTMQISYSLSFQDFLDVQKLNAKRNLWSRIRWGSTYYVNPLLGLLILIATIILLIWNSNLIDDLAVCVIVGSALILQPFVNRFRLKQIYKRARTSSKNFTLDFDPDSIRSKGEHSISELKWTGVKRWAEDEKLFLIYLAKTRFFTVPKRCCTSGQIEELRSLLQRNVAAK
jgi:hypothetical protein